MSFLQMIDGTVRLTEEGKMLPQIVSLSNTDKTLNQTFFNDALTYVFYVYKKDGIYSDSFQEQRQKIVIDRHLPKRKVRDFEANSKVQALIKEYNQRQMTKLERFYYQLEKEMEALLEHIAKIPYYKKGKIIVPVAGEGEEPINVPAEVDVANNKEKAEAIMLADKLVDYGDKLKAKIIKEAMDKKVNTSRRMFDKV